MSMFRVDPRVRAYGKARIDITRRAKDELEWQRQWKEPRYPFPFTWGQGWKHSFQYQVDDFAAEVGFLMDVLGLPAYAFSPSYATFTSPDQAFTFSVAAAPENSGGTPPDTIRIQFMVEDLSGAIEELERRGVVFEQKPEGSAALAPSQCSGCFRTPHGICVDLLAEFHPPVQSEAVLNIIEEEVEEPLKPQWQEVEEPQIVEAEEDTKATEQTGQTEAMEEPAPDEDADPFAGLNLASLDEPPQSPQEPLAFGDSRPEERGTDRGLVKPNGSRGWSHIQASAGNSDRASDHRRGEVFPRSGATRGSSTRGNGDLHRADPSRRAGGARRKNPFSTQDLPPLPEQLSHRITPHQKESSPPPPEPQLPEDMPPFLSRSQSEVEKLDGKINPPPDQPGLSEDEPRYEDLEEGTDKGLEDIFP